MQPPILQPICNRVFANYKRSNNMVICVIGWMGPFHMGGNMGDWVDVSIHWWSHVKLLNIK